MTGAGNIQNKPGSKPTMMGHVTREQRQLTKLPVIKGGTL